jgi:YHS domain-containing protein
MNSFSNFRFSIVLAFWLATGSLVVSAQEIKWQTDLEQAIQQAEKEQKLVLLHFTATWSKSCRELQSFVYSSPQVQRAIQANVIPVRIDVDEQVELTSKYGIGKVPYDIVITPSRRIVSRRESPKDSSLYSSMILRLEKTIQEIAQQGATTIDQNLDDFQELMQKADPIRQQEPITSKGPSHKAAPVSQDSQELNRKFVTNPVYAAKQAAVKSAQLAGNAANFPETSKAKVPGSLKIVNPNFLANQDQSDSGRALTNVTMQPNLQRPPSFAVPSVHDNRPQAMEQVKFIGNPTAVATDFETDIPTEKDRQATTSSKKVPPEETSNSTVANPAARLFPVSAAITKPPVMTVAPTSPAEVRKPEIQVEKLLDEPTQTTNQTAIGLQGKCPVTLIREGRWLAGDKRWGCVHRDQTYLFASQENLSVFLTDPDAYSPLLAGFDPVVFDRSGKLVPGLEEHGVFMGKAPNLRVVLFSDKNNRREFELNPRKYILTIRKAMENSGGGSSQIEHESK